MKQSRPKERRRKNIFHTTVILINKHDNIMKRDRKLKNKNQAKDTQM